MNQKSKILDQIKMYSVLVGQLQDMLDTIGQIKSWEPHANMAGQEDLIRNFISENTSKIRKLQEELEKLGD